jgi:hypothetical protein
MNELFDLCVAIMTEMGHITGLSYKEVNIWVFVIGYPIILLLLVARTVNLRWKLITKKHG